jgi:hypothetical protein
LHTLNSLAAPGHLRSHCQPGIAHVWLHWTHTLESASGANHPLNPQLEQPACPASRNVPTGHASHAVYPAPAV